MSQHNQTTKPLAIEFDAAMTDGVARAMVAPRKVMEANLAVCSEWLAFVGRRMRAQADLIEATTRPGGFDEAAEARRRFLEKARDDYAAEVARLFDLARGTFSRVADAMIEPPRAATE